MDPSAAMMMGQQQQGMGVAPVGPGMGGMGMGGMGMQPTGPGALMAPPQGGGAGGMMGGPGPGGGGGGGGPPVPGGIFFKTRICNEFRDGRCRRGDMCKVSARRGRPERATRHFAGMSLYENILGQV